MKKIILGLILLWCQAAHAQFSEGWYRIGQSNQTEADALMELTADGQTLSLSVGVTYTSQNTQKRSIYISGVSEYAPSVFSKVRFIQKEVSDPIYLDVYVGTNFASGTVTATIGNAPNAIQPMQFQAATIPSGYTVTEIELEALEFLSPFFTPFARSQAGGVDADADPINEMQVLTISGDSICISSGNCVPIDHPAYTTTLALNGNQLTVNDKTVDLPLYELQLYQLEPNTNVVVKLDNSTVGADTRFRLMADDDITTINLVGDSIMLGQDYYNYVEFEISNLSGGVILGKDQNYLFDIDLNPAFTGNGFFIDPKNLGEDLRRLIVRFGNSDSTSVNLTIEGNISGEIFPIDVNGTEVNSVTLDAHPNSWAELMWIGDRAVLVGSSNQSIPIAEQIAIDPISGVNGATAQAALEDIKVQLDAVTAAGGADGVITGGTGTNGALTLQRSNGLSNITVTYQDNDTQLSEAQVDGFVADNGFVSTEADPTVPANIKDGISWSEVSAIPADIADGDANTQLSEAQVDNFIADNGYVMTEADPTVPANIKDGIAWTEVSGIPTDIADGDANTQLSEAQVDAFVADNGFVSNEADPTVPANIKDGIAWTEVSGIPADIADGDANTQLNEAQVDAFVADNGFVSNEADPTVPANIKDGIAWTEVSGIPADIADGDANTQLNEAQVDAFVADNGFVSNEADPTVPANIKDGITWTEVSGKPAFAPTNAEQNVQGDWNVTSTSNDAYIKNKPTIPTATSQLTNDADFANETYVDNAVAGAGGGAVMTGEGNSSSATTIATTEVIGLKSPSSAFDVSVFDNGNNQLQFRINPHGYNSSVNVTNGGQIFAKRVDYGNYGIPATDWWDMYDPFVLKRTPSSSSDTTGYPWDIAADENYLYIKTKDNGWKRVSLSSF